MNQARFRSRNQEFWTGFAHQLHLLDRRKADRPAEFPEQYRRVCQHLALARHRGYTADLIERLNDLAVRGHHHLYRRPTALFSRMGLFIARDFPRAVRAEWRVVLLAALLFYGPFAGMIGAIQVWPDLVYSVVDPAQVAMMEEMYDPAAETFERESDSDLFMFGFYIRNNIGIAFRTFAGGVFAGLGSGFFLVFNGLVIGAVAGHLTHIGYSETFWQFVVTHGAFELTAIVLAGAAGLRLGLAFIAPGRFTRTEALRDAARRATPILYGFTLFLVIAAFIEAFWSSTPELGVVRVIVGVPLWVLVHAYFALAGRTWGFRGS